MERKSNFPWVIILSVIGVISFTLWNRSQRFTCESWDSAVLQTKIKGLVVNKYRDRTDHGERTISLDDGSVIDEVAFSQQFWETVEVGDSLIKQTGTMTYSVKKTDTIIDIVVTCNPGGF